MSIMLIYRFQLSGGKISRSFRANTVNEAYKKATEWWYQRDQALQATEGYVTLHYQTQSPKTGRKRWYDGTGDELKHMSEVHMHLFSDRYTDRVMRTYLDMDFKAMWRPAKKVFTIDWLKNHKEQILSVAVILAVAVVAVIITSAIER